MRLTALIGIEPSCFGVICNSTISTASLSELYIAALPSEKSYAHDELNEPLIRRRNSSAGRATD